MSHEEHERTRNPIRAGVRALGAFVLPALILTGCPGEGEPGTEQADGHGHRAGRRHHGRRHRSRRGAGEPDRLHHRDAGDPPGRPHHLPDQQRRRGGAQLRGRRGEELEENLAPGGTGTLQVDLEPGTYEIYCPVGDHADRGMRMALTVEAGGGGGS